MVTLMVRPRGASEFTDFRQVGLAADGSFAHRMTFAPGASYRYRWTPKPTLFEPVPVPRLSGIVNLAQAEKTQLRAAAAL